MWVALRPVGLGLREVGVTGEHWRTDALIGFGVAVGFAALQFGLIIPATGGAARSDIVVNAAQIGESLRGVLGFVVLAWTGAVAEELFFRGHFLTTLRNAFGRSRGALVGAAVVTVVVFAPAPWPTPRGTPSRQRASGSGTDGRSGTARPRAGQRRVPQRSPRTTTNSPGIRYPSP